MVWKLVGYGSIYLNQWLFDLETTGVSEPARILWLYCELLSSTFFGWFLIILISFFFLRFHNTIYGQPASKGIKTSL